MCTCMCTCMCVHMCTCVLCIYAPALRWEIYHSPVQVGAIPDCLLRYMLSDVQHKLCKFCGFCGVLSKCNTQCQYHHTHYLSYTIHLWLYITHADHLLPSPTSTTIIRAMPNRVPLDQVCMCSPYTNMYQQELHSTKFKERVHGTYHTDGV